MNKSLDRVFNCVAIVAVAMIILPVAYIFVGVLFGGRQLVIAISVLLSCFVGYGLQSALAAYTHRYVSHDGFGSSQDGYLTDYSAKDSFIPISISVVFTIIATVLFHMYMMAQFNAGIIEYYDTAYSFAVAVILLACLVAGIVVWYYPIERLSSIYTILGGCAIFYVETVFMATNAALFGNDYFTTAAIGVPFVTFNICMLIIYNQSNLQKKVSGSVVQKVSTSARMYNLLLVAALILALIITIGLTYVVCSGIYLLIKSLIYIALFKLFYGKTYGDSDMDYSYSYVDSDEAGQMFERDVMSSGNQTLVRMFLCLAAISLLIFIFAKTGLLKKIITAIKKWLREVLDTLMIGREIWKNSYLYPDKEEELNFKDEKKNLQHGLIKDYDDLANATESYNTFLQRLQRLKTFDEQLCFAYAMLRKLYTKNSIPVKLSDTPHEAQIKILNATSGTEIKDITEVFESVRYAENHISDTEAEEVLKNMCSLVKRYMF